MSIDQHQTTGTGVAWIPSKSVVGSVPLDDVLLQVVHLACEAVPAAISGGLVAFDRSGRVAAAVAIGETAREIEAVAFGGGIGPGPEAGRELRTVQIDDMADVVDVYPVFARAALERAVISSLSVPLVISDAAVGALSIYGESTHVFDDRSVRVVTHTAALASPLVMLGLDPSSAPFGSTRRGRYSDPPSTAFSPASVS